MRILALFIIVGGILALSIWAFKLNPSRMEYAFGRPNFTHDQLDKIRYSTDLEELKEIAKNQLYTLDKTCHRTRPSGRHCWLPTGGYFGPGVHSANSDVLRDRSSREKLLPGKAIKYLEV